MAREATVARLMLSAVSGIEAVAGAEAEAEAEAEAGAEAEPPKLAVI